MVLIKRKVTEIITAILFSTMILPAIFPLQPAEAAISSVGTIGSGQSKTAGTSFTFGNPFTNQLDAGNIGILVVAADNINSADGDANEHTSVTDSAGNTWTKIREFRNGQNAAGNGVTVSIWKTKATTNLPTTGTITVNFSGSITAKAASVWEFSVNAGNDIRVPTTGTTIVDAAYDGADVGSVSTSGMSNVEHLHVRAIASERADGTITVTTGFTAMTNSGTTGNPGHSNANVTPEFRIATNTGSTSDPTSTAVDHATTFVAFEEFTPTTVRSPSDTATVSDTVSVTKIVSLSDTVSASDALTKAQTNILSESITSSDTASATKIVTLSDTVSASDIQTLSTTKTLSDTVSASDTASATKIVSITDTITASESLTHSTTKSLSDTVTASDSATHTEIVSITETVTASDTSTLSTTKSISDTVSVSDTASSMKTVSISETVTASDALTRSETNVLSDTVSASDTVAPTKIVTLTDTVTSSDALTKAQTHLLSDTVTASDSLAPTKIVTITDTITASDTLTRSEIHVLSESIAASDSLAPTKIVTITDTITASDSASASKIVSITDTISASDMLAPTKIVSITEIITSSDALTKAQTNILSESITSSDTASATKIVTLSDTVSASDTLTRSEIHALSDTITSSDSASPTKIVSLSDTVSASDTQTRSTTKTLSDTLTASDSLAPTKIVSITDTVSASDTASTGNVRSITETVSASDTLAATKIITITDTVSASDTVSAAKIVTITDTISASDILTRSETNVLSDTVSASDTASATVSGANTRSVSESVSVSDSLTKAQTILLAESVTASDSATASTGNTVSITDTIIASDTVTTTFTGVPVTTSTETTTISDKVELTHTTAVGTGSSVTATLLGGTEVVGGGTITFSQVTSAGTVSVATSTVVEEPLSGFTIVGLGGSTMSLDITTTAGFTGSVQLCINYNDAGLTPEQEALIKLMHFSGTWVDITTSLDTTGNIICGETESLSLFAVMFGEAEGRGEIGGSSRERPRYEIDDKVPPEIVSHYYKESIPTAGKELTVTANIIDDVGVSKVFLLYFVTAKELEFHQVAMQQHNPQWFIGTIPASDVRTAGLMYWIFAEDFSHNNIQSSVQKVDVQQAPAVPEAKATAKNLPAHVLEAINSKPKPIQPVEKLEVISMNNGKEIKSYPDKIIIKNTGNRTVDNIRLILTPDISKSFRLSQPAIRAIEPNANVTVTLELNGSPNRDMVGNLAGYKGSLLVMAEHISPITLPVNIGMQESNYISDYMNKIALKAEQRYNKISLLNSIVSKQPKTQFNYEVATSDGDKVITNPSDEIVIRNLSNKELKNVRMYLLNAGNAFLLEQNNIQYLEPNGQVSIKLIPKIDSSKYSPKDFKGEILIVPSNDNPITIPINIAGAERLDSRDEFEVRLLSGSDSIFTADDKVIIKNIGNRTLDSVRLMLSYNLARPFTLSNDAFQNIEPNEEVVVDIKFREDVGEHKMGLLYDYKGELVIMSEHHRQKVIPINIAWNELSSEHFIIYSRNNQTDTSKAKDLLTFLESNYQNVTSRFGEMKAKTKIYMTNTLEEFRKISSSGESYYAFSDDTIFVCGCSEDVKDLAMKEFVYRITFNKYPNYSNKEKFIFDGENWLMDGITNYIAANMTGGMVTNQTEVFKQNPTSFVWYGPASPEQYGATYTFFEYLHEKYGSNVIDKTLYYLGSGMISNHRCDTLEECAILRAVYDVSGLDMKVKRNTLDVETLVKEWEEYVLNHYNIAIPKDT